MKYLILIEKTEGGYKANCPDFPECPSAYAGSLDQVKANMADAIHSHLDRLLEQGRIPKPRFETDSFEVCEVRLDVPNKGIGAFGRRDRQGGITVYKGSQAAGDNNLAPTLPDGYRRTMQMLIDFGFIARTDFGTYLFVKDRHFYTLSEAASIIAGYNMSGYDDKAWRPCDYSNDG